MEPYIDDLALEAAERFVQTGRDLNEIVAEIALRNDLNTEQIRRVIERANRAVFLKLFTRKIDEFPIASFDRVMEIIDADRKESVEFVDFDEELVDEEEDWYDWDEGEEVDPLELLRQSLPAPEEEEPDRTPEKHKIVLICITQMKKTASQMQTVSFENKKVIQEVMGLVEEALTYVPPQTLKQMLMGYAPQEAKNEYETLVDQVINEVLRKRRYQNKRAPKGSAKKVAAFIVSQGGRPKYATVAKMMMEENVTPSEVLDALHGVYHTTLFDEVVEGAVKVAQLIESAQPDAQKKVDAGGLAERINILRENLNKFAELSAELEVYRELAQEVADTPELSAMLNREWATIVKRQLAGMGVGE